MTCSSTDIRITHTPLSSERVNWRKMASVQDDLSVDEYRVLLRSFAQMGAKSVLAWDGAQIVATMIWLPAERMNAVKAMSDLPCDLSKAVVPSCIYVKAEYEGQGIAAKMKAAVDEQAAREGFETCVYYGFFNERIVGWVKHQAGCVDTGIDDPSGWRVYLLPIESSTD